ncbi:MAG TPA: AAA family ATPase [Rhodospirillaceae bacterium]|nr:AAA family ATPase [Rhodospirillaceae bacterium]
MIVAFVQTKGGVGKTTLAVNLAVERVKRAGRNVLLVDADEQGTASDFTAIRSERLGAAGFVLLQASGGEVRDQVLKLGPGFDDILIDAGGRDTASLRATLTVADIVVVPFQPRSFDVWTLDKVAALIAEAKALNPRLRAYAVLNCADPQGQDNVEAAEALADNRQIRYLDAPLVRRKAFPNCNAVGLGVLESPQPDRKACKELIDLAEKLFTLTPRSSRR